MLMFTFMVNSFTSLAAKKFVLDVSRYNNTVSNLVQNQPIDTIDKTKQHVPMAVSSELDLPFQREALFVLFAAAPRVRSSREENL